MTKCREAIETHQRNFPATKHDCADISQVEPRRYARTSILWASPECTNHSVAKGRRRAQQSGLFGDEDQTVAERSRATMWDVPRFVEVHRYEVVIVENVVDAANWELFRAWLMAMDSLGYAHHIVYLNSMHAPAIAAPRAPQSRDRMYVVYLDTLSSYEVPGGLTFLRIDRQSGVSRGASSAGSPSSSSRDWIRAAVCS